MNSQPANTPCGVPLPDMPCGCRLEVEDLSCDPLLRAKLCAMGILPGAEMEICRSGNGSVCVRVRQSHLVLGESVAKAIVCRAICENDVHPHKNCGNGFLGWRKNHCAVHAEACCREGK